MHSVASCCPARGCGDVGPVVTAGQRSLALLPERRQAAPGKLLLPAAHRLLLVDEQEVLISFFLRDLFVQKCQDLIGLFTLSPADSDL